MALAPLPKKVDNTSKILIRFENKGSSRVYHFRKYQEAVLKLNTQYKEDCKIYIFKGLESCSEEYKTKRKDIETRFKGQLPRDSVTDSGDFIYSDEETSEIDKFLKTISQT